MKSLIQFITVPTADTPGTALYLFFDNRRYLIGNIAEGTQRAATQTGTKLMKINDILLTGRTEWSNIGGLVGMILTLADSNASSVESAMPKYEQMVASGKLDKMPDLPILNIYGPPNLNHLLGTCRRFVFRKGMPLRAVEFKDDTVKRDSEGNVEPTWSDDHISVWAMPIKPTELPKSESSAKQELRRQTFDQLNSKNVEYMALEGEMPEDRELRYDRMRRSIVRHMFDSDWSFDALVEKHISEVQMPAAIFVRDQETHKIQKYTGPMPGGEAPLPDIKVMVRTPWPAALLELLPPTEPSPVAISYIFRPHPKRGKFDMSKALELNITDKKKFSLLTKGENTTNDAGETITPDMVMGPPRPSGGVAVIDLPSIEYVDSLLAREEWTSEKVKSGIVAFVWILGPGVAASPRLRQFMEEMDHCKHVVSSVDACPNTLSMIDAAASTLRLAQVDNKRYGVPHHDNVSLPQDILNQPLTSSPPPKLPPNAIAAKIITLGTGSALPSKYRNVSATLVRVPGVGNYLLDCGENTLGQLRRVFKPAELKEVLKDLRMIWISHLHADHHLGIASLIKAWYSVAHDSTPITEPPNIHPTADSPPQRRLAVVSHMGMPHWLHEYASIEDFGYSCILPLCISENDCFRMTSSPIPIPDTDHSRRISNTKSSDLTLYIAPGEEPQEGSSTKVPASAYEALFGLSDIQAVFVNHCHGAMAVSLTFPPDPSAPHLPPLKVSYSGDCRPSGRFASIGAGTSVLIHEATFDDALGADAVAKKHSTTSEALKVAEWMGAQGVVLTHFSQRYQKIPVLRKAEAEEGVEEEDDVLKRSDGEDGDENGVGGVEVPALEMKTQYERAEQGASGQEQVIEVKGDMKVAIAFDYMRVKIGDIAVMERFTPALAKLLASVEAEGEGSEEVVAKGGKNGGKSGGKNGGKNGVKKAGREMESPKRKARRLN
ncbi:ribonuclease Z mitochondrial precursor [Lophium mytilinum]|uniref:ribonuclease Z n=1 Tax=Lophium mytilinum TaxID=390894 RepID=A0A6A6QMZ9_9PEZI|nr:ribonuclease Z mitochondrial precursor [Lophium mytilinum]